ncbi:hypothetical protein Cni_G10982 [Canna indica]|uniref:DUF668 domain-containing protein n=1 Tax=Canna indica TaxID=4628 RepID=A0AAQ3QAT4_9LILI|nr:hypothetical protein Cni_G10982 [Canna indica]
MRRVKSESWLGRIGLVRGGGWKKAEPDKSAAIGVLAFEVGRLMSRVAQLWYALGDDRVDRLRDEVVRLEGVRRLVTDDDDFLLAIAAAEMMDAVGFLADSVASLGRRCSDPVLQRFDAAFADLVKTGADPYGFEYTRRKMESKVKKMERFVAAGANLYQELEVLTDMEQSLRRMLAIPDAGHSHHGSVAGFKHKVVWQRQQVKRLREASLWVRTYDYVVRLLGCSLFSVVGRIALVFGSQLNNEAAKCSGDRQKPAARLTRSHSVAGLIPSPTDSFEVVTGHEKIRGQCVIDKTGLPPPPPSKKQQSFRAKRPAGSDRPSDGCLFGGNGPVIAQSRTTLDNGIRKSSVTPLAIDAADEASSETKLGGNNVNMKLFSSMIDHRFRLLNAPTSTLGGAALALHYANVIVVIEKFTTSPHLIGPDARGDLYSMLTTSIKAALRARLKSYAENLASSVYDPVLVADWSVAMTRILEWLAPLAHNTIKWQTERSFEQQSLVSSSNVLLLQTLYFANQKKAEDAITELLVGLNYMWRYRRELSAKTTLECTGSRNFDDGSQIQFGLEACPAMS